jgi:hypothetical protein
MEGRQQARAQGKASISKKQFFSPPSRFCHVASHVDWSYVTRTVSESNVTDPAVYGTVFFIEGDAPSVHGGGHGTSGGETSS